MKELEKALALIEAQQGRMAKGSASWCVGEQLKEMLRDQPEAAGIVAADLEQAGMGLAECERKIADFAKAHKQGSIGFCGPQDAERIIREFYGMPAAGNEREQAGKAAPAARRTIRLTDFL